MWIEFVVNMYERTKKVFQAFQTNNCANKLNIAMYVSETLRQGESMFILAHQWKQGQIVDKEWRLKSRNLTLLLSR